MALLLNEQIVAANVRATVSERDLQSPDHPLHQGHSTLAVKAFQCCPTVQESRHK